MFTASFLGNDAIWHQFDLYNLIWLFFEIALKPPSRKKDGEIADVSEGRK